MADWADNLLGAAVGLTALGLTLGVAKSFLDKSSKSKDAKDWWK